jgi:hypothetical protein
MARRAAKQSTIQFDRIAATCAALVIVGLVVFLLIRNEEIADARLFFALRLVLSFSAAVLGATIPGFLSLGWSRGGFTVRAGGALALFVLTYVYTPDLSIKPESRVTIIAPGGVAAGEIKNSPITINSRSSVEPPGRDATAGRDAQPSSGAPPGKEAR